MWKNIVEPDKPQMTIWRMRIACWTTRAKNTHSEYVILIAFPRQQWLHERASMLRYMYIACFVYFKKIPTILLCEIVQRQYRLSNYFTFGTLHGCTVHM